MIITRHLKPFWQLTAIVVMLQLIVLQAMASSGAFHKCCHDHADQPEHECAVTMMLSSGYDVVEPSLKPVEIVKEQPLMTEQAPKAVDTEPGHLAGGVLAHAPSRGP